MTEILVTPRSITSKSLKQTPELEPLRAAGFEILAGPAGRLPSLDDLAAVSGDVVGWLAGVEHIGSAELDLFPSLRVISRNGAGTDNIDVVEARRRGVEVVAARGANARGVAELTIGLMLSALRRIPSSDAALRVGRWQRIEGREFPDLTIGIAGYGSIGSLVGQFCEALGAQVLVSDPYAAVEQVAMNELLERSDVVSLHCPPPPDGSPLIDAAAVAAMRDGSVLINTARWSLVDHEAVYTALESGHLSTYAIDAFDHEPPQPHPLFERTDVILTPHLGGFTGASVRRAVEAAVRNLLATLGK